MSDTRGIIGLICNMLQRDGTPSRLEAADELRKHFAALESQLRERDDEIERLKRRLEIDTCRDGDGNLVPAPANMPDGIAARDYTIRQQQEEIRRLREALSLIERFGHRDDHGSGHTCAEMAEKALQGIVREGEG